ncbi:hypothetical protein AAFF_G00386450 [Aldrovandia affinis]|uniref:Uncharacterized protein n=1 Tax=Aldrovandia affinis TaxID=143900 RepID=A0AAD7WMF6_9TELE|nr:hypothetical protein AAFF_G00386450 [Aldrovandia affinis]
MSPSSSSEKRDFVALLVDRWWRHDMEVFVPRATLESQKQEDVSVSHGRDNIEKEAGRVIRCHLVGRFWNGVRIPLATGQRHRLNQICLPLMPCNWLLNSQWVPLIRNEETRQVAITHILHKAAEVIEPSCSQCVFRPNAGGQS